MTEIILRFKDESGGEFPQWEKKRLGEMGRITMGQSPDGSTYSTTPNKYILVQGNADMRGGWVTPRVWTNQATKMCNPGDIILSVRAPAGAVGRTKYKAVIGRGVCAITAHDFVYYSLEKRDMEKYWKRYACGSTFESLNSKDIANSMMNFPSLPEQEKIADFLSSYDDMIDITSKRLRTLQKRKLGLLQGIFSQTLRFRDSDGRELLDKWRDFVEKGVVGETSRMYISVNARDMEKTKKMLLVKLITESVDLTMIESITASLAARPENRAESKWLLDFDSPLPDKQEAFLKDLMETVEKEMEAGHMPKDAGVRKYRTMNGMACVVSHKFDCRELLDKWRDFVELKRDDMLYVTADTKQESICMKRIPVYTCQSVAKFLFAKN